MVKAHATISALGFLAAFTYAWDPWRVAYPSLKDRTGFPFPLHILPGVLVRWFFADLP